MNAVQKMEDRLEIGKHICGVQAKRMAGVLLLTVGLSPYLNVLIIMLTLLCRLRAAGHHLWDKF
jgi:hypothetical protein